MLSLNLEECNFTLLYLMFDGRGEKRETDYVLEYDGGLAMAG